MTTRYVDVTDGDNAYNGLAAVWDGANGPKKTCNGAENTPVEAGDLIHVRSGTYRETLTGVVSGNAGNPIEYRGDYTGVIWPGGGVVRITPSLTDAGITALGRCLSLNNRHYRTFRGFAGDSCGYGMMYATNGSSNIVLEDCISQSCNAGVLADGVTDVTVRRCAFVGSNTGVVFGVAETVDSSGIVVESCIVHGCREDGIVFSRHGGAVVRNCRLVGGGRRGVSAFSLTAGQTVTVHNCLISTWAEGLRASVDGFLVEDYNAIINCPTARVNVSAVGAHSTDDVALMDTRWFFEALTGGRLVVPYDLAPGSPVIDRAGTSPPATDMRGTGTIGAQREWGPLEYDSTLEIEGGSGGGGPSIGGRRVRGIA